MSKDQMAVMTTDPSLEGRLEEVQYNAALVKQVIDANLKHAHSFTKAQKSRSEVKASSKKLYRQKKTGRARSGNAASPLRRGGGRAFAATPRQVHAKVNRRMHRQAIAALLGRIYRDNRLKTIEPIQLEQPSTAILQKCLLSIADYKKKQRVLLVVETIDSVLNLSARNLPGVSLQTSHTVTAYDLASNALVLATNESVRRLLRA